jgi:hypothetical protein
MSIERISERVLTIQARVAMVKGRGEEATKQALVLPMLDALGYDIWNPLEVCPEFEADFAVKKQGQKEKVDLAVVLGGEPRIFFEVKPADEPLDGHHGQLARYFNGAPSVSLAVLTNGHEYRFYTDTGEPNLMDPTPFHVLKLDGADPALDVLARFHKAVFSPGAIRDYATELNYTARVTAHLRSELDLRAREPSEALVRWVLASEGLYEGRVVASVVERFRPIVKNALQQVLRDVVRRSVAALDEGMNAAEPTREAAPSGAASVTVAAPPAAPAPEVESGRSPITTAQELELFALIREQFAMSALAGATIYDAGSRRDVPLELSYKDTTVYFGLFFNKPGWWFARAQLDGRQKWLAVNLPPDQTVSLLPPGFSMLPPSAFGESRIAINGVADAHALGRVVFAAMAKAVEDRGTRDKPA